MRAVAVAVVVAALIAMSCGSTPKRKGRGTAKGGGDRDETAAEYQRRKMREAGELDEQQPGAGTWGGWKYQGERDTCQYVLGRKCYSKRENACKAAKCKTKCNVDGGGPAKVSCAKT